MHEHLMSQDRPRPWALPPTRTIERLCDAHGGGYGPRNVGRRLAEVGVTYPSELKVVHLMGTAGLGTVAVAHLAVVLAQEVVRLNSLLANIGRTIDSV